jgi:hypothetical protein
MNLPLEILYTIYKFSNLETKNHFKMISKYICDFFDAGERDEYKPSFFEMRSNMYHNINFTEKCNFKCTIIDNF